ncbi:MAG: AAA family ATPase, partial [Anaerolineae bacterium]|nr:AAA family ATPase [Anaerolineae bacterium]
QHLAFLFWPDSTEAQARTNLRKQIFRLRRGLPDADHHLHADSKNVRWQAESPLWLDVAQFEAQLTKADDAGAREDQRAEREALVQAASLYKGDLLPGSYEDWVLAERERLSERFTAALERLILLCEEDRQYRAAIEYAQQLLHHDPIHEATHRRLMRLHALNGDRARALRAYHTCVTALERELGVEPSTQTRAAYQRLLEMDTGPSPRRKKRASASPLIGREAEWVQLQEAWRATSRGQPQMVLLEGEPGIGKTRLAEELLGWAGRQGMGACGTRCYASEGRLAFAPVASWLRAGALRSTLSSLDGPWLSEIARLLPEIAVQNPKIAPPGPLTESWQRQRLFEALSRAFRTKRQLILLLDDLQWCDRETLEWLPYLLMERRPGGWRGQRAPRLLVVGTLRSEERHENQGLASLSAELRRSRQLTEIELSPLDEGETASLAESVAGQALEPALKAELYTETEGNPFFLIETVRAWLE